MLQSVSGQALERLIDTSELLADACHEDGRRVPYVATFQSNPAVPPVITLHTACVICGSTPLCTLYRQTIGEIQHSWHPWSDWLIIIYVNSDYVCMYIYSRSFKMWFNEEVAG